jgi:NACalpha-BTF3-like transcription factor
MDNENQQPQQPKTNKHDSGAADLEKVTDYAEEQEIKSDDLNKAINALSTKHQIETEQKAQKEKELASVKIRKEDVDMIAQEMEISKIKAERVLRENNGNPVSALRFLINSI